MRKLFWYNWIPIFGGVFIGTNHFFELNAQYAAKGSRFMIYWQIYHIISSVLLVISIFI